MINIKEQFIIFCYCTVVGVFAGLMYDLLSALKQGFKLKKTMYFLDSVFWMLILIVYYFALWKGGKGQLRAYTFMGCALGLFVYFVTLSKSTGKWMVISVGFIRKIIMKMVHPVKKMLSFADKTLKNLMKLCKTTKIKAKFWS
ncbi:MAG: spore cortex biosynthesis protein YabQ [Clostridia bacterium]|nr:spore cortex biosynthesis protein YabQ [Clostridia bacterium]